MIVTFCGRDYSMEPNRLYKKRVSHMRKKFQNKTDCLKNASDRQRCLAKKTRATMLYVERTNQQTNFATISGAPVARVSKSETFSSHMCVAHCRLQPGRNQLIDKIGQLANSLNLHGLSIMLIYASCGA